MRQRDLKSLQATASARRADYQGLQADFRRALEDYRTLDRRLASLQAAGANAPRDMLSAAQREVSAAGVRIESIQVELEKRQTSFDDIIRQCSGLTPQDLVRACDDHFPFLLCPVRLEFRFATGAQGSELLLRIAPDAWSIDNLDELLTTAEIAAAETFWTKIWRAGGVKAGELAAWRDLAADYGPNRAAWIARSHSPTNEKGAAGGSNRPTAAVAATDKLNPPPLFPAATGRLDSWSRASRAIGLPDRFVALGYVGDDRVFESVGATIPDTLMTGPDPQSADGPGDDQAPLGVDPGMKWMVDFDEAVSVGMGMRIPLPVGAQQGFDELIVLGLRASATAEEGEQLAETMIRTHLYGLDGFSFVPQGTATNDIGPGGPSGSAQSIDDAYDREFGPAEPAWSGDWRDKSDGRHFAEAIGIDPGLVQPAANSGGRDQADAYAMNTALWPATMGSFLEEMMSPLLNLATIGATHRFFVANVSGRGPVPAIRVGNQPYGIEVATAISRWKPDPIAAPLGSSGTIDDPFRTGLHALLMKLDGVWTDLSANVAMLGQGQDKQAVLLDVLGLQPRSAGYRQRFALSLDQIANQEASMGSSDLAKATLKVARASSQTVLDALGIDSTNLPEIYHRLFFNRSAALSGPFVDRVLSDVDPLAPLSEDGENYLLWLAQSDVDTIRRNDFGQAKGAAIAPPKALLYRLLNQALQVAYWDAAWNYYNSVQPGGWPRRADPNVMNIDTGVRAQSRYELLYSPAGALADQYPDLFRPDGTIASFLSSSAIFGVGPTADLAAARTACDWLSRRPTRKLALAAAEHFDLCSYHLGPWLRGLPAERLRSLRNAAPSARGLYVGAFGYLEGLSPKAPANLYAGPIPAGLEANEPAQPTFEQPGAEHILAPSLNHAVTAAVLRSAYLTHSGPGQAKAMSVDISSQRVRGAIDLLDGVRGGQGISELLGYVFERELHDSYELAEVDKFIYPLRQKFPLASGQQIPSPAGTPIQAIEARNVIDGLRLVNHIKTTGKDHYPFGLPDLEAATAAEAAAIDSAAAHLADMLDSVADLMLAEGAYNGALGNFERAGAALNSISGAAILPEPEILRTPRTGHAVTHRICLVLPGQPAAGAQPESGTLYPISPRALMEPELNAWLDEIFGNLKVIAFRVGWYSDGKETSTIFTLGFLGIEPIDLLYIAEPAAAASGASELDLRIGLAVRRFASLEANVPIKIDYIARIAGAVTLFQLLPLIRAVKGLTLGRRYLGATDFAPPAAAAAAPAGGAPPPNPNRWLTPTYENRVKAAGDALETLGNGLQHAAKELQVDPTQSGLARARTLLLSAAGYGIPGAVPPSAAGMDEATITSHTAQILRVSAAVDERVAAYVALLTFPSGLDPDSVTERWTMAAKAIFGRDFIALPLFLFDSPDDISSGIGDRHNLVRHAAETDAFPLETWLAGLARVSPAPAHLEQVLTLTQLLGRPEPELVPLQLPYRANDHWLGMGLPDDYQFGEDRILATTIFGNRGAEDAPKAGLLLAEWTEIIPSAKQTAAVTFCFDAPAAEPVQALLLAVTPEITGAWAWDDLVDTVRETIHLAKNRMVEPRQIDQSAFAQLLPAIMIPFTPTGASPGTNIADIHEPSNVQS